MEYAMDVGQYLEDMRREARVAQLCNIIDRVPGFLSLTEGFVLLKLAETWPVEGDTIEIGSFKGRSTCFLGSGVRRGGRGRVIAVDHFKGSPEHQKGGHEETREIVAEGLTFGVFQNYIDMFQLADVVTPLSGSSQEVSADYDGRVRMLFIDGEHSYDGTKADYEAWEDVGAAVRHHLLSRLPELALSRWRDQVHRHPDPQLRTAEADLPGGHADGVRQDGRLTAYSPDFTPLPG